MSQSRYLLLLCSLTHSFLPLFLYVTGQYNGDEIEENIAATLIKIFFRELPTNLLNHIEKTLIDQIAGYDTMLQYKADDENGVLMANAIFKQLHDGFQEEVHFDLLSWLLDVMCQVVEHSSVNKMSAKNMAIVLAPNLYRIHDLSNPLAAITLTQRIAKFTEVVLVANIAIRRSKNAT